MTVMDIRGRIDWLKEPGIVGGLPRWLFLAMVAPLAAIFYWAELFG